MTCLSSKKVLPPPCDAIDMQRINHIADPLFAVRHFENILAFSCRMSIAKPMACRLQLPLPYLPDYNLFAYLAINWASSQGHGSGESDQSEHSGSRVFENSDVRFGCAGRIFAALCFGSCRASIVTNFRECVQISRGARLRLGQAGRDLVFRRLRTVTLCIFGVAAGLLVASDNAINSALGKPQLSKWARILGGGEGDRESQDCGNGELHGAW